MQHCTKRVRKLLDQDNDSLSELFLHHIGRSDRWVSAQVGGSGKQYDRNERLQVFVTEQFREGSKNWDTPIVLDIEQVFLRSSNSGSTYAAFKKVAMDLDR
jgi:hypothetical protein